MLVEPKGGTAEPMERVLCAGLIAADLIIESNSYPAHGTKSRADASRLVPGGGAMNAALAIAALGGGASLSGAIGKDDLGAFLTGKMQELGVDHSLVRKMDRLATSASAVLVTGDGERTVINHREEALFFDDLALPSPFPFDAVLVDTRWPDAAAKILTAARNAGVPAVLDGEAPVRLAKEALHQATHIVFSEQGLTDFTGSCDAEALVKAAQELGCWVAVTRGAEPVLCHNGTSVFEVPTFPARAVDTLGAGDVWHGAFALALARKQAERDAVLFANAAAALKVAKPSGAANLPRGKDVQELVTAEGQLENTQ